RSLSLATALVIALTAISAFLRPDGRAVEAAPGGAYTGTGVDVTVNGETVSMGYEVPSPHGGCASSASVFGAPLFPDASGFRVDASRTAGTLAGRTTPGEAFSVVGFWDGFAQTAAAGAIVSAPDAGVDCAPLRRTWLATNGSAPIFGTQLFSASGPATIVGESAAGGTVQVTMNAKGDAASLFSVTLQHAGCTYSRSTQSTDYGAGSINPLLLDGPAFGGLTGFGSIAVVLVPGGARGAVMVNGTGDCPTVVATFSTQGDTPAPAATATATATPTSTPVATATPTATSVATPTATATPAPAAAPAGGQFFGTPIFGSGGQALSVFSGGTTAGLEARAKAAGAAGVWVQDASGAFLLLVIDGPSFINEAFRAAFSGGVPANTPVTLTR
ncbi:MAG: hypothetical protein AB7G21_04555, partial [Dehalococcoidia bacterium]